MPVTPSQQVVAELAPTGVLRAAINMGNFLLVTGKAPSGDPSGVSADIAAAIAARLGVPVKYVPYARPGEMADDAEKGLWDIGNIGAEPQRAAVINFTAAYCEIEATYLVPAGSPIRGVGEVDQPGKRLAVTARSAYGLWLENNIKKAELVQFDSADAALKAFVDEKMDAYAGLRPALVGACRKAAGIAHPRWAILGRPAGGRHAKKEYRRVCLPARVCRGGETLRRRREPHRAARRHRPSVGRAARLTLNTHPSFPRRRESRARR